MKLSSNSRNTMMNLNEARRGWKLGLLAIATAMALAAPTLGDKPETVLWNVTFKEDEAGKPPKTAKQKDKDNAAVQRQNTASASLRCPMMSSTRIDCLDLRGLFVSRLPMRSLSLRPGDSLTTPKAALSMGFRSSISLLPAIQAKGLLAVTLEGLTPSERASLRWSH